MLGEGPKHRDCLNCISAHTKREVPPVIVLDTVSIMLVFLMYSYGNICVRLCGLFCFNLEGKAFALPLISGIGILVM